MAQRPQRRRPGRRRRSRLPPFGRSWLPIALVAVVLFAVGLFFGIELAKPPPPPDFARQPAESAPPTSEIPPEEAEPLLILRQPAPGGGVPRVSIVIDDLGRSLEDLDRFAGLEIPITYSVLPFEVRTPEVVARLRRRGVELMCHLPMEAKGDADPGPGALYRSMSRAELASATRRALDAVPGAVGVNNHMGSGLAAEREALTAVLTVVAERDLFFLDSRTSADTLGYTLARRLGVPAAERQVFLDTSRDREFIRRQFAELLAVAEERGGAIGIGHPYPETLEILRDQVPGAVARGYRFVTASALMDGSG